METTSIQPETDKKFLTQDELSSIKKLNEDNQELVIKFGQIEFQLQLLSEQKSNLVDELKATKANEMKIFQKLESKYGKININLETGEIAHSS